MNTTGSDFLKQATCLGPPCPLAQDSIETLGTARRGDLGHDRRASQPAQLHVDARFTSDETAAAVRKRWNTKQQVC